MTRADMWFVSWLAFCTITLISAMAQLPAADLGQSAIPPSATHPASPTLHATTTALPASATTTQHHWPAQATPTATVAHKVQRTSVTATPPPPTTTSAPQVPYPAPATETPAPPPPTSTPAEPPATGTDHIEIGLPPEPMDSPTPTTPPQ